MRYGRFSDDCAGEGTAPRRLRSSQREDRDGVHPLGMDGHRGHGGFLDEPDAHVVAICDVQQSARERAAAAVNARYGDQKCAEYPNFREMLARRNLDVVLIATGGCGHPLIAIEAARHGKHMYCEESLALSVAGAAIRRQLSVLHAAALQFLLPPEIGKKRHEIDGPSAFAAWVYMPC